MRVGDRHFRTIWYEPSKGGVEIIDQTKLPHRFETRRLINLADAASAIADMWVRGAPLIGVTAAYGVALAIAENASDGSLAHACTALAATRPTAVNLVWALTRMREILLPLPAGERAAAAFTEAERLAEEDVVTCAAIGDYGLALIEAAVARKPAGAPVNILTHCNAGWLATVDWGTATAPIYKAHEAGIPVHVWVDETRPRNQGASLTAWELGQHGVPHTIVVDNAGGHLMQIGKVDLCIVGTDRTTATGDVCNKIGTYLKALAARDSDLPFYVAAPSSSIDFSLRDGLAEVPIETRSSREITHMTGRGEDDAVTTVLITPDGSPALNYGFDITPARLVTGLITERGVIPATEQALARAFPERTAGAA
ncbi:MAG TPA: S-methyl-5-thioribose-1-phosphate isomerase [Beijerinckiaceae bacterium]|nr:S-methyl-5-thioribose-1-phosphate isomerase [Beijerinckiaceae bacterium]